MDDPEQWGPDLSDVIAEKPRTYKGYVQRWHLGERKVCRLYFISAHPDDLQNAPIKIGISRHPEARIEEMQRTSPVRLVMLKVVVGGRALERRYHETFAADRLHGEWFKRSEPLMAVIRGK